MWPLPQGVLRFVGGVPVVSWPRPNARGQTQKRKPAPGIYVKIELRGHVTSEFQGPTSEASGDPIKQIRKSYC